jgi:hypothetical protein
VELISTINELKRNKKMEEMQNKNKYDFYCAKIKELKLDIE